LQKKLEADTHLLAIVGLLLPLPPKGLEKLHSWKTTGGICFSVFSFLCWILGFCGSSSPGIIFF